MKKRRTVRVAVFVAVLASLLGTASPASADPCDFWSSYPYGCRLK
jgi:hypothetical protein